MQKTQEVTYTASSVGAVTYTASNISAELQNIRSTKPLVHNLTNYVAMDIIANSLLAIGASPIMSHSPQEFSDLAAISNVLVLNIGTLDTDLIEVMKEAISKYRSKPIVLDPVGAGATNFRTDKAMELLDFSGLRILRGNASEILGLISKKHTARGVDSTMSSLEVKDKAIDFALREELVVVISGEKDIITDGRNTYEIDNGNSVMSRVTGMGCVATAIVGAFLGQKPEDPLLAAITGMGVMGVCGELAAEESTIPGSFRVKFIDALYSLKPEVLESRIHIRKN